MDEQELEERGQAYKDAFDADGFDAFEENTMGWNTALTNHWLMRYIVNECGWGMDEISETLDYKREAI